MAKARCWSAASSALGIVRTTAWIESIHSTLYACPNCKISYEELEPRTFSFNSPYGACPSCEGLGWRVQFDPDLILPDRELSLDERAVAPWKMDTTAAERRHRRLLEPFATADSPRWKMPIAEWKPAVLEQFLYGDGGKFPGLLILLEKKFATATRTATRQRLEGFRGSVVCVACGGSRLRPEARNVRFAGRAIHEIAALSVSMAAEFFRGVEVHPDDAPIYQPIASEIRGRLAQPRWATRLSHAQSRGRHAQRRRVATHPAGHRHWLGPGRAVVYILDDFDHGLHPRDNSGRGDRHRQQLPSSATAMLAVGTTPATVGGRSSSPSAMGFGLGYGGQIVGERRKSALIPPRSRGGIFQAICKFSAGGAPRRVAQTLADGGSEGVTHSLKNVSVQFPPLAYCSA